MGKIKVQMRSRMRIRKRRLAIGIGPETQLTWIGIQISSEQHPQNSMSHHPVPTIFLKVKAPGLFKLFINKH
jgi:hypothetical protein